MNEGAEVVADSISLLLASFLRCGLTVLSLSLGGHVDVFALRPRWRREEGMEISHLDRLASLLILNQAAHLDHLPTREAFLMVMLG